MADAADSRYLIVGLGNPGPKYALTRHNAGFLVLDALAERVGGRVAPSRALGRRAELLEGRLCGLPISLVKPLSFMNESGGPVNQAARFYKTQPDHLVVVHDELDLPFGDLRMKSGGGDGGHNGLRSITSALGTRDYLRVRFGIDRPPGRQDPADYVLREFSVTQRRDLPVHVERCADAVEALLTKGLLAAQNEFNS
jgi:PTH1 family peptidyl-tRNA hydrolase